MILFLNHYRTDGLKLSFENLHFQISKVLENCDELFKFGELSSVPNEKKHDSFDSNLFVFRPSTNTFEALIELAETSNNNGRKFKNKT